jgi:dolichol-phosphate mannosyltransferase
LHARISSAVASLTQYEFVILFIDNHSTDGTAAKIKDLAGRDPRVRLIVNTRNFGHIRSPYYGILKGGGAATIYLASDLQDPPELIPEFVRAWEEGSKIVLATKPRTEGAPVFAALRKLYYRLLNLVSEVPLVNDVTGFGLYDHVVLDHVRRIGDPYPYLRGLICELGYEIKLVPFVQPRRLRGVTKNNFYSLFDIAMLGLVRHSKVPLRIATFTGFALGFLSLATGSVYLVLKLLYWETFPLGIAPLIIGLFFLFGMLFLFIGVLGEYVASIHTYVQNRPVVVEQERFNFDADDD